MDNWITEFIHSGGYWGILLLMFTENIFPPIPSELIMPLAGYVASQGELNFIGTVLAGTLGTVLGALPLYYIGRVYGEDRLRRFADRHGYWFALSTHDIDVAKHWFDRHGRKAVFFCRLVPGIRSLISIPAGMARMPLVPFLLYSTFGSLLWIGMLAYSGLLLGESFDKIGVYLGPVSKIVFAAIVVLYVIHIVRYRMKHRRH